MIGNVVDLRTDSLNPEVDVVYEPSAHDGVRRLEGLEWFPLDDALGSPAYFVVKNSDDTTVQDALLKAETEWPFPVTVFFYDKGTSPIGWLLNLTTAGTAIPSQPLTIKRYNKRIPRMNRTMNSPLRIAELPVGQNGGILGLSMAPGKKGPSIYGGTHARDLDTDLNMIRDWGAVAVVTLMEDHELIRFEIPNIGDAVHQRFMEWHHLPIIDGDVPADEFEARWPDVSARLRSLLLAGNRIFVHCRGGLGRAGMISARLLVELGAESEQVINNVRAARSPDAIETMAQEEWVGRGRKVPATIKTIGTRDRAVGAFVGLAVGDAVGTTIEFSKKPRQPVLFDMVGGGPFKLEPGQWTDDTSMALALADSLLAHPDLDPKDLMNRFVSWRDYGQYTHTGTCFDIGVTTSQSLSRYLQHGNPLAGDTSPDSAGNGSIMRLAPVAVRHWNDRGNLRRVARLQSRTTHAADEPVEYSDLLAEILADAIEGRPMHEIVASSAASSVRGFKVGQSRDEVEGSGYVVACLHAALWAVSRTTTFESAVLMAANLGRDADTTAAVAGQIAGAIYGHSGIPEKWLKKLAWRDQIEQKANDLFTASRQDIAA